jgi:hypothetical protein
MTRFGSQLVAPTLVGALSFACSDSGAKQSLATRVDSGGVEIVTNTGPDRILPWTVAHQVTIGGKDDGPEAFSSLNSGNVAADTNARLWILDDSRFRVFGFDTTGQVIAQFGGKGAGPGELQNPWRILVLQDGSIGVFDAEAWAFVRYDANGAVLPMLTRTGGKQGSDMVPLAGGAFVFTENDKRASDGMLVNSLIVSNANRQDTLLSVDQQTGMLMVPQCQMGVMRSPVFAPQLKWKTDGRRVVAMRTDIYELRLYRQATLERIVRRDVRSRKATEQIALKNVEPIGIRMTGAEPCELPPDKILEETGFVPTIPLIARVALAPGGELWVLRYALNGEAPMIDIFSVDGEYVGTVEGQFSLPAVFVTNSLLARLHEDSATGLSTVELMRIQRK